MTATLPVPLKQPLPPTALPSPPPMAMTSAWMRFLLVINLPMIPSTFPLTPLYSKSSNSTQSAPVGAYDPTPPIVYLYISLRTRSSIVLTKDYPSPYISFIIWVVSLQALLCFLVTLTSISPFCPLTTLFLCWLHSFSLRVFGSLFFYGQVGKGGFRAD